MARTREVIPKAASMTKATTTTPAELTQRLAALRQHHAHLKRQRGGKGADAVPSQPAPVPAVVDNPPAPTEQGPKREARYDDDFYDDETLKVGVTDADDVAEPPAMSEWNDRSLFRGYSKFTYPAPHSFTVKKGDCIHVRPMVDQKMQERRDELARKGESIDTSILHWIARVVDVRATDSQNIWMSVEWFYNSVHEMRDDHVEAIPRTLHGHEIFATRLTDFVHQASVLSLCHIVRFDEMDPWTPRVPLETSWVWYRSCIETIRQRPNKRQKSFTSKKEKVVRRLVPFSKPSCFCGMAYQPLPLNTAPMVFCPRRGCNKWYHIDCLRSEKKDRPLASASRRDIREVERSGLHLLKDRRRSAGDEHDSTRQGMGKAKAKAKEDGNDVLLGSEDDFEEDLELDLDLDMEDDDDDDDRSRSRSLSHEGDDGDFENGLSVGRSTFSRAKPGPGHKRQHHHHPQITATALGQMKVVALKPITRGASSDGIVGNFQEVIEARKNVLLARRDPEDLLNAQRAERWLEKYRPGEGGTADKTYVADPVEKEREEWFLCPGCDKLI